MTDLEPLPTTPPAPAGPGPRRLSRAKVIAVVVAVPLALLAWLGVCVALYACVRGEPAPAPAPREHAAVDGAAVYAKNCAACHGLTGEADGPTSMSLVPKARRFGADKFRLGTTANSVPTDADVAGLVRRGIPGSAMPAFDKLTDEEVAAVTGHVRTLARAGAYKKLLAKASESGDADPAELLEIVDRQLEPSQPLAVPASFVSTPEALAHGREVYTTVCAQCHGPAGRGDGPQVKELKNEDGSPTRPRDLTAGVFKCGGAPGQVYARIMLGMPGTPMPSNGHLPARDVNDVLAYVLSLSARPSTTATAADARTVAQAPAPR